MYIHCKMTTNNAGWSRGWFYMRNDGERLPAYTGKVLRDKLDLWGYGVSPLAMPYYSTPSHTHPRAW